MQLSVEQNTPAHCLLAFLDTLGRSRSGHLDLYRADRELAIAGATESLTLTRYVPRPWVADPLRYIRGLVLHRLSRVGQIRGAEAHLGAIRGAT